MWGNKDEMPKINVIPMKEEATSGNRKAIQEQMEVACRDKEAADLEMMEKIYGGGDLEDKPIAEAAATAEDEISPATPEDKLVQAEAVDVSLDELKNDLAWVLQLKDGFEEADMELKKSKLEAVREALEGLHLEKRFASFDFTSEKEAVVLYNEFLEIKNFIDDAEDELEKAGLVA